MFSIHSQISTGEGKIMSVIKGTSQNEIANVEFAPKRLSFRPQTIFN